jgi:hypothetical protein
MSCPRTGEDIAVGLRIVVDKDGHFVDMVRHLVASVKFHR